MNKFMVAAIALIGKVALGTALLSVNTTCSWIAHQPEVPKNLKSYKKKD